MLATWVFRCIDNGGKRQAITIKAANKTDAIKKGFEKARKHAAGDIGPSWECKLIRA